MLFNENKENQRILNKRVKTYTESFFNGIDKLSGEFYFVLLFVLDLGQTGQEIFHFQTLAF